MLTNPSRCRSLGLAAFIFPTPVFLQPTLIICPSQHRVRTKRETEREDGDYGQARRNVKTRKKGDGDSETRTFGRFPNRRLLSSSSLHFVLPARNRRPPSLFSETGQRSACVYWIGEGGLLRAGVCCEGQMMRVGSVLPLCFPLRSYSVTRRGGPTRLLLPVSPSVVFFCVRRRRFGNRPKVRVCVLDWRRRIAASRGMLRRTDDEGIAVLPLCFPLRSYSVTRRGGPTRLLLPVSPSVVFDLDRVFSNPTNQTECFD
jgi:hypothetical protein